MWVGAAGERRESGGQSKDLGFHGCIHEIDWRLFPDLPLKADLGPGQPGNRRHPLCPGRRRCAMLTDSYWRCGTRGHRGRRGSSPSPAPAGRGQSHRDMAHTSPGTTPNIPMHVIQSPRVGQLLPHRMRRTTAVLVIPRVLGQIGVARVIPIAEPRRGPRPARILPLRLRRQPIHTIGRNPPRRPLALRELAAVVRGVEPTDRFHRTGQIGTVILVIGRRLPLRSPLKRLGLLPITARYSPCVTSYFPIQNPLLIVTAVCGPSTIRG